MKETNKDRQRIRIDYTIFKNNTFVQAETSKITEQARLFFRTNFNLFTGGGGRANSARTVCTVSLFFFLLRGVFAPPGPHSLSTPTYIVM